MIFHWACYFAFCSTIGCVWIRFFASPNTGFFRRKFRIQIEKNPESGFQSGLILWRYLITVILSFMLFEDYIQELGLLNGVAQIPPLSDRHFLTSFQITIMSIRLSHSGHYFIDEFIPLEEFMFFTDECIPFILYLLYHKEAGQYISWDLNTIYFVVFRGMKIESTWHIIGIL